MDVGGRLRSVREARGMSQRDLASRAGLTNGAISLIEQNKSSPSVASLKALLDAIPITMSEFFAVVEHEAAPKYFYSTSEFIELSPQDAGLGENAARVSLRQLGDAAKHSLQILHEVYPPGRFAVTAMDEHADAILDGWDLSEFRDESLAAAIFGDINTRGLRHSKV